MVNHEPPDEFVEIRVRFIVVYLLDSCHDSANDDLQPSKQWRGWSVDRAKFIKDAVPPEHAGPRDTETFRDEFEVMSKFPELKSTFFEIPTDFTIAHNTGEVMKQSDKAQIYTNSI